MALDREDIMAIGEAVGRAVGEAIAPVLRESNEANAARTDGLRREVFDAIGRRVSRDECARTHAALPPVALLGAVGALGVIQVVAVYLLNK